MHHHHMNQAQKDIPATNPAGIVTNWRDFSPLASHVHDHLFLFALMSFHLETIIPEILINCRRSSGDECARKSISFNYKFAFA